jgi:hypothetical protein
VALLTDPADYIAVRAAMDLSLKEPNVPDSIIQLDIFQGAAEREVLARDPEAESREDDELARVKAAAVYLTAALLLPAVPQLLRERLGDQTYERLQLDVAARVAALRKMAFRELGVVSDPVNVNTIASPHFFGVLHGDRGKF